MGTLYIVATPIGNLKDITYRAVEVLNMVDGIACEDTRHSGILLKHYGIQKPLISYHSHSGQTKVDKIVSALKGGQSMALISDAGTPGISDPAYVLIQACLKEGIDIVPLPGPSAVITALSASGLPTDKFLYLGFLPVKKGRQTVFKKIAEAQQTVVFYESPHRLIKTLEQLEAFLKPTARLAVAKELTKIHETYFRGTSKEVLTELRNVSIKGEYVVMVLPN